MEYLTTEIPGVVIIKPRVFVDRRGYFFESYNKRDFDSNIGSVDFVQDNQSRSVRGVVRGLHFQCPPFAQAKLVECVEGSVLDVAVDIRRGSPSYGKYIAVELTAENHCQLFLPRGIAHGFAVLSDVAVFRYKCDNFYAPQAEGGIAPDDPDLDIDWHLTSEEIITSDKDRLHPLISEFNSPFVFAE